MSFPYTDDDLRGGRLRSIQREMYEQRTAGGTLFQPDTQSA